MNNHDMINLEVRLIVIEFLIMIDIDGYFTVRINNRHKFF